MLLSVCILMQNEAEALRRLAAMVRGLADELVVVCDTPVPDAFHRAAADCGARLVSQPWQQDFAAARNAGLRSARGEWVFWLDSDESLLGPEPQAIRQLLARTDALGYFVTIQDTGGTGPLSPREHLSLYRRRPELHYRGRVHERFAPPLESLAEHLGLKLLSSPVRLSHSGYAASRLPQKLARNIALLELELAEHPGQLACQIELGRALLLTGNQRGHEVLAAAGQALLSAASRAEPPTPLAAALLEYALGPVPPGFPLASEQAAQVSERWFPSSPPLLWLQARWHYQAGRLAQAASPLERLLHLGETDAYDHSLSFNLQILGDEARLNLGVCYAKLGQTENARRQLALIKPGSSCHALAKANLAQLAGQ